MNGTKRTSGGRAALQVAVALETPEERELQKKRAELTALGSDLADRELECATLQNELRSFEARYLRTVGALYAELDDLEAQIAEAAARRRPQHEDLDRRATEARAKAVASAEAIGGAVSASRSSFTPGDELKALYREVARRMHPDCAVDDRERERRHRPMAEANAAYAAGDAARLRAILEQWHSNPEMVEGEGIGADLIRTIRKIHQVERRLAELSVIVTELRESPLHTLLKDASTAAADNRDLLAEMADRLRADITEAQSRLANAVSTMEPAV